MINIWLKWCVTKGNSFIFICSKTIQTPMFSFEHITLAHRLPMPEIQFWYASTHNHKVKRNCKMHLQCAFGGRQGFQQHVTTYIFLHLPVTEGRQPVIKSVSFERKNRGSELFDLWVTDLRKQGIFVWISKLMVLSNERISFLLKICLTIISFFSAKIAHLTTKTVGVINWRFLNYGYIDLLNVNAVEKRRNSAFRNP